MLLLTYLLIYLL